MNKLRFRSKERDRIAEKEFLYLTQFNVNYVKILSLISKYWFSIGLAIVISVVILLIIPHVKKLKVNLLETEIQHKDTFVFYQDLNYDGVSEIYRTFINQAGNAAFDGRFRDLELIDQWNFNGVFTKYHFLYFYDIDQDGSSDVILLTCHNDSILIHALNPLKKKIYLENYPLYRIRNFDDFILYFSGCYDLDGNGNTEALIVLAAGFEKQPRKIISFEFETKKLKESPFTGFPPSINDIRDIDNDNKPEILVGGNAPGNYHETVPFTDNSVWSILFDHNLGMKSYCLEFPFLYGGLLNFFFKEEDGHYTIINLAIDNIKNESWLVKTDLKGKKIIEKKLPDLVNGYYGLFNDKENSGNIYLYNRVGGYYKIDSNFDFIQRIKNKSKFFPYLYHYADIDQDGKVDYFSDADLNGIWFSESLEQEPYFLELPLNIMTPYQFFSFPRVENKDYNYYYQIGSQGFYVKYQKNPLYRFRYFLYFGIFLISLFLVEFIRWQQKIGIQKRANRERELMEWQLQAARNQLDPHFTFNALNAIGSMIYQEKKKIAYDYFTKFSHLFRKSLEDGNKLTRGLKDELEFAENYLSIQQFRFPDIFEYEIRIQDGVDLSMEVPKLIIQNFVENAIYHGLIPRKKNGKLTVEVTTNKRELVIAVEDNGVGREASQGNKRSTGKGMKLMQDYFDLLNKNNSSKISFSVKDLSNEGIPTGTRVELNIPYSFKYR